MSKIEHEETQNGKPSAFACPDCGGVLWETKESGFLQFRCRVGHGFTAKHLGAEQRQQIESALWAALSALGENACLYKRIAERAAGSRHEQTERTFRERAVSTMEKARVPRFFVGRE